MARIETSNNTVKYGKFGVPVPASLTELDEACTPVLNSHSDVTNNALENYHGIIST